MHKIDFNNYKKKQRLKRGIAGNQNLNVIQKILRTQPCVIDQIKWKLCWEHFGYPKLKRNPMKPN